MTISAEIRINARPVGMTTFGRVGRVGRAVHLPELLHLAQDRRDHLLVAPGEPTAVPLAPTFGEYLSVVIAAAGRGHS